MPRRERSRIRTGSNRRARWTAEEAGRVLHALEESGLSQKEFCEREGLIPERLRRWQRKLERRRRLDSSRARLELRPVQLVGSDRMEGRPFELELPAGVRLQVPCDFDEGSLTRLLAVLRRSA
jgi:transposase-like protein